MSTEELIFTIVIFVLALAYIYKSLFKKNSCGGSCGCGSNNKEVKKEKTKCCES